MRIFCSFKISANQPLAFVQIKADLQEIIITPPVDGWTQIPLVSDFILQEVMDDFNITIVEQSLRSYLRCMNTPFFLLPVCP